MFSSGLVLAQEIKKNPQKALSRGMKNTDKVDALNKNLGAQVCRSFKPTDVSDEEAHPTILGFKGFDPNTGKHHSKAKGTFANGRIKFGDSILTCAATEEREESGAMQLPLGADRVRHVTLSLNFEEKDDPFASAILFVERTTKMKGEELREYLEEQARITNSQSQASFGLYPIFNWTDKEMQGTMKPVSNEELLKVLAIQPELSYAQSTVVDYVLKNMIGPDYVDLIKKGATALCWPTLGAMIAEGTEITNFVVLTRGEILAMARKGEEAQKRNGEYKGTPGYVKESTLMYSRAATIAGLTGVDGVVQKDDEFVVSVPIEGEGIPFPSLI